MSAHGSGGSFSAFRRQATVAIQDIRLQESLEGATGRFRTSREVALANLPDAEEMRDRFKAMREATLAQLATHLQAFEQQATQVGVTVHWARDAAEAGAIVLDVARGHGVRLVTKSKSMATEEIQLNQTLIDGGVEPVETDLGEWIIQLAEEPPSHIIAPAIHKTREQVAALFTDNTGETIPANDIPRLTAEARRILRQKFLDAGMGVSGVNIGVAETGSIVLVTNEGNGRMVTSTPPVHVAIMGIEKIAPSWDDAALWLSLLARSATGQPMSIYTSIITGPAQAGDPDGPQEVHIVLLDNGRSRLLGTAYEEVLQCIRCGACLNACPVYREAGGHAYGSPYSGPIGAVVSPLIFGLDRYPALPHASSLCGACRDVCPARIDLPRMLLALRADEVSQRILPWHERKAEEAAAAALANRQRLSILGRAVRLLQRPLATDGSLRLPEFLNPAAGRDLPSLAPKSFRDMWADGEV